MPSDRTQTWTIFVCDRCGHAKFDAGQMVIHSRDCGGDFQPTQVVSAAATARPDFTTDELRAIKTALADTWRVDPSQSRNVADTAYAKVLALLERASLGEGEGGR